MAAGQNSVFQMHFGMNTEDVQAAYKNLIEQQKQYTKTIEQTVRQHHGLKEGAKITRQQYDETKKLIKAQQDQERKELAIRRSRQQSHQKVIEQNKQKIKLMEDEIDRLIRIKASDEDINKVEKEQYALRQKNTQLIEEHERAMKRLANAQSQMQNRHAKQNKMMSAYEQNQQQSGNSSDKTAWQTFKGSFFGSALGSMGGNMLSKMLSYPMEAYNLFLQRNSAAGAAWNQITGKSASGNEANIENLLGYKIQSAFASDTNPLDAVPAGFQKIEGTDKMVSTSYRQAYSLVNKADMAKLLNEHASAGTFDIAGLLPNIVDNSGDSDDVANARKALSRAAGLGDGYLQKIIFSEADAFRISEDDAKKLSAVTEAQFESAYKALLNEGKLQGKNITLYNMGQQLKNSWQSMDDTNILTMANDWQKLGVSSQKAYEYMTQAAQENAGLSTARAVSVGKDLAALERIGFSSGEINQLNKYYDSGVGLTGTEIFNIISNIGDNKNLKPAELRKYLQGFQKSFDRQIQITSVRTSADAENIVKMQHSFEKAFKEGLYSSIGFSDNMGTGAFAAESFQKALGGLSSAPDDWTKAILYGSNKKLWNEAISTGFKAKLDDSGNFIGFDETAHNLFKSTPALGAIAMANEKLGLSNNFNYTMAEVMQENMFNPEVANAAFKEIYSKFTGGRKFEELNNKEKQLLYNSLFDFSKQRNFSATQSAQFAAEIINNDGEFAFNAEDLEINKSRRFDPAATAAEIRQIIKDDIKGDAGANMQEIMKLLDQISSTLSTAVLQLPQLIDKLIS